MSLNSQLTCDRLGASLFVCLLYGPRSVKARGTLNGSCPLPAFHAPVTSVSNHRGYSFRRCVVETQGVNLEVSVWFDCTTLGLTADYHCLCPSQGISERTKKRDWSDGSWDRHSWHVRHKEDDGEKDWRRLKYCNATAARQSLAWAGARHQHGQMNVLTS